MTNFISLLAASNPAGGAATKEIIGATAGALVATTALFALGLGHRAGRTRLLERAAERAGRIADLPPWVALPSALATGSLIVALTGMYWDISLHIDNGRDPGPLANPAHYLILFGLFGIFSAGFLAMAIPKERPCPTALRLYDGWHAPLGGIVLAACGAFALVGFPLDDGWHRLFGQDVTLWGPTHLMLIGGASLSLVGIGILLAEGTRSHSILHGEEETGRVSPWLTLRRASLAGGFLIGLSTFQAEFDFGVPQFDFLFHPMLIVLAASIGLISARMWAGPGGAIGAVVFFWLVRGFVTLMVSGVWDESTPHIPLYVVEALIVEATAVVLLTRRPLAFGLLSGLLIGTVGTAAEWAWSHVWMPLPWPQALLPEVVPVTIVAGLAGGALATFVGGSLRVRPEPYPRGSRVVYPLAGLLVAGLIAFGLMTSPQPGVSARVQLQPAPDVGGGRAANATVTVDPPSAADDAKWMTTTAWQGGGLVVDRLTRVRRGVYRTNQPVPVHGSWKSEFRLHKGRSLLGVPVYLPNDPAIPAKGVPAGPSFERPMISDKKILQREAKTGAAALTILAYGVVLLITLSILGLIAWALVRLATVIDEDAARRAGGRARFRPAPSSRKPVPTA
jgi:hypothetical protein